MKARLIAVAAILLSSAAAADDISVSPDAAVAGKSQGEWSSLWWQWAGSFDDSDSPVADRTGRFCQSKQTGPVWFLAGTYGTQRTVRTCKVPKDKYLFFPLINYVVMPESGEACATCCANYTNEARNITDAPSDLILEVDGTRVERLQTYRQVSPACFDMGARSNPPQRIFPSAANGYYVMLKPLAPGKHVLNFGGRLPGMSQAVTYTLEVE